MCQAANDDSDLPPWVHALRAWIWRNRDTAVPVAVAVLGVLVVIGILVYRFTPTDLERAEADLHKAWAVVNTLEDEAPRQLKDWRGHNQRAAEHRKLADENKDSTDVESLEWHRATARGHARLADAASDRRDHLLRLAAEYRRLVAEAHCEIIRAKDARERGTPYEVAPRVRELLKPILTNH
jgi:hypothetical protein